MIYSIILAIWLAALGAMAQAKQGMVGYGINMYHPWCCTPCSDVLSKLYLNCTTFPNSTDASGLGMMMSKRSMSMMMAEGVTSDECYAQNQPFQQTLAYCIKSHCDPAGLSSSEQNKCFQTKGYGSMSLKDSLPEQTPTQQFDMDAMWLNMTMLVNEAMYQEDYNTVALFETIEVDHVSWSIAIFVVSVAIPLLTGAYMFIASRATTYRMLYGGLLSMFHADIALPALFGKMQAVPMKWVGYVPSRAMTIWISSYIVLNVLASSLSLSSVQPNTYFTGVSSEMAAYVGNRAGVLSFANLALSMLFSMRNSPLLFLSGWDMNTQLVFHRWSARVSALQAVVHSIVYTADYMYYKGPNQISVEAAMAYWWWGIIATITMSLMIGLSTFHLRSQHYEIFLVAHILLCIVSLIGCWYHIIERFQKQWGYEKWLYIAFAFWSYDRLVRSCVPIYHAITKSPKGHVEAINGTNVVTLTIKLKKPLRVGPGMHIYAHFPSLGRFWECHPFTICDWTSNKASKSGTVIKGRIQPPGSIEPTFSEGIVSDSESEKAQETIDTREDPEHYIQCMFRTHGGMTSNLRAKIGSETSLNIPVSIDGPYGGLPSSHFALSTADTVLCIAGGIGITHAAAFVKQMAEERLLKASRKVMPRCTNFVLAWSVRERALLDHVTERLLPNIEQDVNDGSMHYKFWLTGSSEKPRPVASPTSSSATTPVTQEKNQITHRVDSGVDDRGGLVRENQGRMDVRQLVGGMMSPQRRVAVIVCGPGSLTDEVRSEVVRWAQMAYVVDFLPEAFAW